MKKKTKLLAMLLAVLMIFPLMNVEAEEAIPDVYKNIKVYFYDENDDYKLFEKDIPKETTLGELLGEDYPILPADPVLGEFKGWSCWEVQEEQCFGRDTALILPANLSDGKLTFLPVYQKKKVWFEYRYLTESGWKTVDKELVLDIGTPEEEIRKMLPVVPEESDSNCKFLGWGEDNDFKNDGQIGIDRGNGFSYLAVYDNYPIYINRTYIDQNGNVKSTKEKKYYPKGTKYEDILAEYQGIPEDASTEYTITGWNMADENGAIESSGEIGYNGMVYHEAAGYYYPGIAPDVERGINFFDLAATYDDKSLEIVDYRYINTKQESMKIKKYILCDKGESLDSIKEKAMENVPDDHLEALEYQGDWKIAKEKCNSSGIEYYLMEASYGKVILRIHQRNKDFVESYKVYAAEPGDVIYCPKGYGMTPYEVNAGGADFYDSYVIPEGTKEEAWWWLWDNTIQDDYEKMIDDIEGAEAGTTVSTELESGVLDQSVLESLKGKDVSISLTVKNENTEVKWNISGINIPEGTLSDVDFSVTKKDKESGNIDAVTINALAGNRTAEQLVFGVNESLSFKPQFTLAMDIGNGAEKGVLLQKDGDTISLTDNAIVTDGTVTFDLEQKADSVIVYGTNGDTDGDNTVKIKDAMQILQHAGSRNAMNDVQKGFADTDCNNKINLQDVMREMHYISGRSAAVY